MSQRGPSRRSTPARRITKTPRTKKVAPPPPAPPEPLPTLQLGFVRGVSPSKWAERWRRAVREQPLELVPLDSEEVASARESVDVLLERTPNKEDPPATGGDAPSRHAVRLYEEAVALVVSADHEYADRAALDLEDLKLIDLLDHPDHQGIWPSAQPWQDPSWAPSNAESTLELVASGLGGALLPLPLARHLSRKRTHAVIPITKDGESLLPGSVIWASWRVARDANDIQRLIGVLRGRTPRSSR